MDVTLSITNNLLPCYVTIHLNLTDQQQMPTIRHIWPLALHALRVLLPLHEN